MLLVRLSDVLSRGAPAIAAMLLWGLALASAALWWLHLPRGVALDAAPASAVSAFASAQRQPGVARALGHNSAEVVVPDVQKRFQLLGVVASHSGHGSALLAVDGQPPQVFVLGQLVVDDWRLQQVAPLQVQLASSAGSLKLAMPSSSR